MKKSYRLISMPSANCYVSFVTDANGVPDSIYLLSYGTRILRVSRMAEDTWEMTQMFHVNYSTTTARHVNRFTTELFGRNLYHVLKDYPLDIPFSELLSDREVFYFWNHYESTGKLIRNW